MEKSSITIEFDAEGSIEVKTTPMPRMTYAELISVLAVASASIIERFIDGDESIKSARALFVSEFLDGRYEEIDQPEA